MGKEWLAAAACVLAVPSGCDDDTTDDGVRSANLQCTDQLRYEGTLYNGLSIKIDRAPATKLGLADRSVCEDTGEHPRGVYYPDDPQQVEVWSLEGYQTTKIIVLPYDHGSRVYADEGLPERVKTAISCELMKLRTRMCAQIVLRTTPGERFAHTTLAAAGRGWVGRLSPSTRTCRRPCR